MESGPMTVSFPPKSRFSSDVEKLLSVFRTVIVGRTAIYLSSPLTTGRRFSEWRERSAPIRENDPEYAQQHRRLVVEPNRHAAGALAERLRKSLERVVIDPTTLPDVPDWSQEDYRFFWGRVIEEYAAKVVFMDGWPQSSGSAYEFLVAQRTGAECLDEGMAPLTAARGRELIGLSIEDARRRGLDVDFLRHVHAALTRLSEE
jgi:hypothetical protein